MAGVSRRPSASCTRLPPTAALEKELVGLGLADTMSDTARRVLERSAEQAGFFEAGSDRLVMPGFVPTSSEQLFEGSFDLIYGDKDEAAN